MKVKHLAIGVIGVVGVVGVANWYSLGRPLNTVLSSDPRNAGVEVSARYQFYANPNVLVFDVQGLTGSNSRADLFRVVLQYADALQDITYSEVHLSYGSDHRFTLKGEYFQQLGQEYNFQNPVYTMRTFPENVYTPDGNRAFSSWTGGALGVMNRQMEDFNNFHDQWYFNDMKAGI